MIAPEGKLDRPLAGLEKEISGLFTPWPQGFAVRAALRLLPATYPLSWEYVRVGQTKRHLIELLEPHLYLMALTLELRYRELVGPKTTIPPDLFDGIRRVSPGD